ncbi:serine/threonine-protein phosphatase 2A activator isoform X2 [Molossus molossus]|uniref:serine/threonine-protein phosphatase 2A activator isoform X2 n=1 Tax=Molossus molossus TaxID=27622 RepID=UPI001746CB9F|nr:serine/threonine-protein phosphatase 2A activator isoform X2 [Molossus molossus]
MPSMSLEAAVCTPPRPSGVLEHYCPWFFGGYPCSHSELYHSKKGDSHCSGHGQMEAFSGKICQSCTFGEVLVTFSSDVHGDKYLTEVFHSLIVEMHGSPVARQAYADYIGFILTLNEGVKGKKLTFEYKVSEAIEKLVALLNTLDRWIDETPPMDQPSRFGNKAYRTWYAKLDEEAENLVATVVPTHLAAAVPEVAVYLKESVGNSTRIDYGTGHEAAFAAFLCCLCKIGVLRVDDQIAIVFKVFNRYLEVMRKLQKTYRMEPAGSQGVWGLDDFQFLPFIWGSSQLIDHPYLEPRHFVDEKAVNENHKDYMFLECILFITEMKTGPFAEHSNQLWNISAVPTWSKVNQGLIRMYKAECLEKFPVIQHFKFGSLLPIHPVSLC